MLWTKTKTVAGIGLVVMTLTLGGGYGMVQVAEGQAPAKGADGMERGAHAIKLKNTSAAEVREILAKLFISQDKDQGPQNPIIVAEPQTNTILLMGSKKQQQEIQKLVEVLDLTGQQSLDEAARKALTTKREDLRSNVRLTDLAKAKQNAAMHEARLRQDDFDAGRGDIHAVIDASKRLLESSRAIATTNDEIRAAYETHRALMKRMDDVAKARYDAGRIAGADYFLINYHAIEAEMLMAQAKPATDPPKK